MKKMWAVAAIGAAFVLGFVAHGVVSEPVAHAQSSAQSAGAKVYELRTYTAPEGKLEELHARFKNHTLRIFQKHGMSNVAYFRPQDSPLKENTLIYLIAHPSREAAKQSWSAFGKDPEWQKVAQESQVNGKIVAKVESVFLDATDYSPMK
jgi:hypothetical protein